MINLRSGFFFWKWRREKGKGKYETEGGQRNFKPDHAPLMPNKVHCSLSWLIAEVKLSNATVLYCKLNSTLNQAEFLLAIKAPTRSNLQYEGYTTGYQL